MKRREFIVGSLAAGAVAAVPVAERPRLFYDSARIKWLRGRLRSDAALGREWNLFLQHADKLLNVQFIGEAAAQQGSGDDASFGKPSQQIADMAFTLGLAHHVTGREAYAAKLRQALLHYAAYKVWHGPGFTKRVPPWHSELNTARFCVGAGAGYDAIHHALSQSERHEIADALARKGVLATLEDWLAPQTRIHALDSMGHNWWSVCVSSAGVASLALLGDDTRAPEWLDLVNRGLAGWFAFGGNVLQNKAATFGPEGGFYESVGYANYALSEYLRYRLAYSNVFPGRKQPDFAPLEKICEFFCQTFYPSTSEPLTVNFGDGAIHDQVGLTIRLLIENEFPHPGAGWYLAKVRRPAHVPPQAFEFLFRKSAPPATAPALSKSILYPGIGWAMLRDSWNDNATMLAVKSGFTWNHAHADAGSFILFHAGVPVLIDSGTCSYGNPAYPRYYVQSPAHNVILFNGQGEPAEDHYRGVKFPGQLHRLVDKLGVKYIFADATGPMAEYFSRKYRHWLWFDDAILVFDDLMTHQEGTFDWLLHYQGTAEPTGNGVRLTNGPARVDVQFLYPSAPDLRNEQGLADHLPDVKMPYLAFRTRESARVQKFIAAVVPYPSSGEAARVQSLSAANALGVRVQRGNRVTDVYLNLQADGRRMHANANNTIASWDTDAYLLAWTRPADRRDDAEATRRIFIAGGSYLRRDGKVYLDSSAKMFQVWEPGR